jgi:hypothetical protein
MHWKRLMYVYGVLVDLLFHVVYYSKLSPVGGCKIVLRVKEMPKAWETLMISLQIEESWSSGGDGVVFIFWGLEYSHTK